MNGIEIFYPVLAHVLLVIMLFILLATRKARAVTAKAVDLRETAINNKAWTSDVVKVSNNIENQFETPILFYIVCVVSFLAGAADTINIALAWAYVALRYVHSYVHTGSNYVPNRMKIFSASLLIVLILLVRLVVQMASSA